jgi:N-acyl-D-aspartate/D-glutamate deacylase
MAMDYDLKIVGGTIVDGTGAPGRRGDVGIANGRIVALGDAPGSARRTIDAAGRVVAPGFVDIHTHYDAQVLWDRMCTISPWHGVTTVVIGNCGFGVAPTRPSHRELILRTLEKVEGMSFEALEAGLGQSWPFQTFPDYLDTIEKRGVAINVGALIGHTPVRTWVMGEDAVEREASPAEIAEMRRIVAEAMDAGALGFATSHAVTHHGWGGRPVPSRASTVEEIREIVGAMGDRGIMQATIGPTLFFDQFADIARTTGRPISWTALLARMTGPGGHRAMLDRTRALVEEGLKVVPQVACRPLNFDYTWDEPFPFEMLPLFRPVSRATDLEAKARIYRDPEFRRAFKELLAPGTQQALTGWYDRTAISLDPAEPANEERGLVEVAAERGVHPVDFALDKALATNFKARFRTAFLNWDEDEVGELLADPNTVVGLSDAGAHASQLCDACFATHLLGHWVRERKALGLEQAVRLLTSRPAEVFGIADRGVLAVGRPADVVVFDPATVGASKLRRVHDLPAGADRLVSEARGIEAVIVNGTLLREAGEDWLGPDDALPGRLLRGGKAA